jgi:SAM-dependent methyltransferase
VSAGYYGEVAAAFDRAAPAYSADYGPNPIMAWLEEETYALLAQLFPAGSRLLEIGCGDGALALRLAEAGRFVAASDISPAMIAAAEARATSSPAAARLRWLVAPAGEVAERLETPLPPAPSPDRLRAGSARREGADSPPLLAGERRAGGERFDGAYSNFGPLNCEPDLARVAAGLARLIRPGGALLCSVMNRWCAWEIAWGLLAGHPRQGLRRLRRGWVAARMSAGVGEPASTVSVRYYTPGEFARPFRPAFRIERVLGFPVLIPPPYMAHRWPGAAARLAGAERCLRLWPLLRALGDHFLIVLRRQPETEEA